MNNNKITNAKVLYKVTKEELEKMYPTSRILKDLPISHIFSVAMTNLVNNCKIKDNE